MAGCANTRRNHLGIVYLGNGGDIRMKFDYPDHAMAYAYLIPGLYDFVLALNNSDCVSGNEKEYRRCLFDWLAEH